jgi:hypothetical protein
LAVSNARLRAEIHARVAEVAASRRRIVEAADEQRRKLELELRQGAERRLTRVAQLVAKVDPELERQLSSARSELAEFARGIHPATLTESGLAAALRELAERSPVPVVVGRPGGFRRRSRTSAYFVCSRRSQTSRRYAVSSRA